MIITPLAVPILISLTAANLLWCMLILTTEVQRTMNTPISFRNKNFTFGSSCRVTTPH